MLAKSNVRSPSPATFILPKIWAFRRCCTPFSSQRYVRAEPTSKSNGRRLSLERSKSKSFQRVIFAGQPKATNVKYLSKNSHNKIIFEEKTTMSYCRETIVSVLSSERNWRSAAVRIKYFEAECERTQKSTLAHLSPRLIHSSLARWKGVPSRPSS